MAIRPPTASDVDRIRDLACRASCAPIMDWPALVEDGDLRVLTQDSDLVGILVLADRPDHLLLESMIVDPARSGQGFAKALLAFAEHEARNRGHDAIRLRFDRSAADALLLHSLGYRETRHASNAGDSLIHLQKIVL